MQNSSNMTLDKRKATWHQMMMIMTIRILLVSVHFLHLWLTFCFVFCCNSMVWIHLSSLTTLQIRTGTSSNNPFRLKRGEVVAQSCERHQINCHEFDTCKHSFLLGTAFQNWFIFSTSPSSSVEYNASNLIFPITSLWNEGYLCAYFFFGWDDVFSEPCVHVSCVIDYDRFYVHAWKGRFCGVLLVLF